MGLLGKLFKTGIAAGTAYAAVKIGQKYKEKSNGETPEEKFAAFKDAANEVYEEAAGFAKDKAPAVTAKAEELFGKAKEAMPGVISTVSEKAQEAAAFAKDKAPAVTAKAEELWGKAKDYVSSLAEDPVDGEVVEFDEAEAGDIEVEIIEEDSAATDAASCDPVCAEAEDFVMPEAEPAKEDTIQF